MATVSSFASARQVVGEFTRRQRPSITAFWDDREEIFFRTFPGLDAGVDVTGEEPDLTKIKRLTSTVTCLESLLEAPAWFEQESGWTNPEALEVLKTFMHRSLATDKDWLSDGAAWVYCRVRTLGSALRLTDGGSGWSTEDKAVAAKLIVQAWSSTSDGGGDFGLRESITDLAKGGQHNADSEPGGQYPANAFLTYWGLLAAKYGGDLIGEELISEEQRTAALGWMRRSLATQIAFRYSKSTLADPQQLLWSLTGLVRFGEPILLSDGTSADHQLVVAGLKAFFEQQRHGTWARGAPLFSYRNAGNAYAYVFETLAELVSLATSREIDLLVSELLIRELSGYSRELMQALDFAEGTGQRLTSEATGWSSGHHPHRHTSESWATASVFRFAQALRRLVGRWSCNEAGASLGWRRPAGDLQTLRERGGSWNLGSGTIGGFLSTAFVHSILRDEVAAKSSRFLPDPDQQIRGSGQFRSSMLFGPPGTGKTTLVQAVAAALDWNFVEVTPAQFLDQGVDHVSSRADEIFKQMMELDRCVVLLDEIDELIRSRTADAGTLERFFTTTMLPRLAKLWENGRVLFFVNTNAIEQVDRAIVRSQRFDAAVLVLPSGYVAKTTELKEKFGKTVQVSENAITKSLLEPGAQPEDQRKLGWFALVRHDQLEALAAATTENSLDGKQLLASMERISRELARLDWNLDGQPKVLDPGIPSVPSEVANQWEYERRDARAKQVAKLATCATESSWPEAVQVENEWVLLGSVSSAEEWAEKVAKGKITPDGFLHVAPCTSDVVGE